MKTIRRILCPLLLTGAALLSSCVFTNQTDTSDTLQTNAVHDTAESTASTPETNAPVSAYQMLKDTLKAKGTPYTPPSSSKSGYGLPYLEYSVNKLYEAKTGDSAIIIGMDPEGQISLISDHYKALVVLTVYEDNSMHISVYSEGNYECEETVTSPTAISEASGFADKNLFTSYTGSYYAPRYYLFYAMHLMDEVMGELGEGISFEALGYTYADHQTYQYHLYS